VLILQTHLFYGTVVSAILARVCKQKFDICHHVSIVTSTIFGGVPVSTAVHMFVRRKTKFIGRVLQTLEMGRLCTRIELT